MPITRSGYAAPRGTTTQRGYGHDHRKARRAIAAHVDLGLAKCARCGNTIRADEPWDLDHTPDRNSYLGASHTVCNRGNHNPGPQKNL